MDIKGVCYDTGRAYSSWFVTRQRFDPAATRRDLQVIRDDLHANAVRFQGTDITRLITAATDALHLGLRVWLSPELFGKSRKATITNLVKAAAAAEPLHQQHPRQLTFCVGTEASLFTSGIVPGRTVNQRVAQIRETGPRSGTYTAPLQTFLAEATTQVKKVFHGPLTYAALPFEDVDWSLFDVIGVDLYRKFTNDGRYREILRRYLQNGLQNGRQNGLHNAKPVVNAEFGHTANEAAQPDMTEFGDVDTLSVWLHRRTGRLVQPRLKQKTYTRNEHHQARELTTTLSILDAEGAAGAFIWTFADPWLPHSADPRRDLDVTSTALVKTHADGSWAPKEAFTAVASFYAS